MIDTRVEKLARLLVNYSLRIKKGDWVRIQGAYASENLMRAVFREALSVGGHPYLDVEIPGIKRIFVSEASDAQFAFQSPGDKADMRGLDKLLSIWGGWNSKEMTGVNPVRSTKFKASRQPYLQSVFKRITKGSLRWCGTLYPTLSSAQDAEMSLEEYENFVFRAGKLHKRNPVAEWKALSKRQEGIVRRLSKIKTLRIVGKETDLTVGVAGRNWINCDGQMNFPDGEVFTGPIENSADGTIRYAFPAVYDGREVQDVRLTFRKGRVIDASAGKGREFLHAMLNTDEGARRLGELAFGTNDSIQRFTRNTLFDEKIGGTMHLAIGASIPESGGTNKSALHWDMVCDTRKGFTIYGDGRPIHKNGKFLFE